MELLATTSGAQVGKSSLNRIPCSTYRLQLGADLSLERVRRLLPYLHDLGITDVYVSPLFRARTESSHGYDVVDHSAIDPAIGDLPAFAKLATEAKSLGMGILLDVVPNHMGINDPANRWWHDVLENGEGSYFADYFDIEWHPPARALQDKILLPFLGEPFGTVLERGELQVVYRDERLQLEYGLRRFPLTPVSWPLVLGPAVDTLAVEEMSNSELAELRSVIAQLRHLPSGLNRSASAMDERYREQRIAAQRLSRLLASSSRVRVALDGAIHTINGEAGNPKSFDELELLLGEQWYRLAYWRVAADEINYRRFFDVNDLAAIRVEDSRVFEAVHRLVAELLEAEQVTGLRIDHPDGLRDPLAYFKNLQSLYRKTGTAQNGNTRALYILAEKILSDSEELASDWEASGTTGYDFLNIVTRLQVHPEGLTALRASYESATRLTDRPADVVYESRRTVLLSTMASELNMLSTQLYRLAQQHRASRDFTQAALQRALREILASMTVYRTYARADSWEISETDYRTVMQAVRMAKRRNRAVPHAVFDFIASVLLLEHPPTLSPEHAEERRTFALKFQQVSGPVAAKGVEDTAFYRYYPLASLNEVGGELDAKPLAAEEFHRFMSRRALEWPHSMSATSTHDSKRGEDMRARLNVLSEIPRSWHAAFARWQEMNARLRSEFDGEVVPDANEEYLIYQTLVGIWPTAPPNADALVALRDRVIQYMEKALREAKIHTSWMSPSESFESAVREFITGLFAESQQAFRGDLSQFAHQIAGAGFVNALSQLLLKIVLPGMPDFYRGTELWDFNLVDPDNRRSVDYEMRQSRLDAMRAAAAVNVQSVARELVGRSPEPDVKLWFTHRGLQLRRDWSDVFTFGEYIPLTATGSAAEHIVAFARRAESSVVICIVPRFVQTLIAKSASPPTTAGFPEIDWSNTQLILPHEFPSNWTSPLTGERYNARDLCLPPGEGRGEGASSSALPIAELFEIFPAALIQSTNKS